MPEIARAMHFTLVTRLVHFDYSEAQVWYQSLKLTLAPHPRPLKCRINQKGSYEAEDERCRSDAGDPYGTRTRVFAVRGRRPGPLDDGAVARGSAHIVGAAGAVKLAKPCRRA